MKIIKKHEKLHVPHLEYLRSLEGTPLAAFKSRAGAFIIDIIVITAIIILVGLITGYSHYHAGALNVDVHFEPFHNFSGIIVILVYFGTLPYLWKGQTIGKRILRIRIISLKSKKLSISQSLERSLGYGASVLEGGFGFVQALWYENCQAVHDRIAETAVIKRL